MKMRERGLTHGLLISCAIAASMCLSLAGCSSSGVSYDSDGNYVTECMAGCDVADQDISYMICLKVTTDLNGEILSVEDAGTEVPDGKDGLYIKSQDLFDELVGRNSETIYDVDVISGATSSSEAILSAVGSALNSVEEAVNSAS